MAPDHHIAPSEQQTSASADCRPPTSEETTALPAGNAYLKVFGADLGVFECGLSKQTTTIGRSEDADITLPNRSVSRAHARITHGGGRFILTDANSGSGTTVNGKPADNHVLSHGDNIQIATYALQFYTHRPQTNSDEVAARAKTLLRSDYMPLPSTMRVKFRTLVFGSASVFESNETMKIGQGGLLIPTPSPPGNESCLELHMDVTKTITRQLLGEIVGVIEEEGTHWMCVKLHSLSKKQHEVILASAKPGPWTEVSTPDGEASSGDTERTASRGKHGSEG